MKPGRQLKRIIFAGVILAAFFIFVAFKMAVSLLLSKDDGLVKNIIGISEGN